MGHSLCVLLVAFVLMPCAASAQARVERKVIYRMYSGAALLLDIHYPSTSNGVGIIFVPGSGWGSEPEYDATGIKDRVQPTIWVPPLTNAGYTVFVANHRATPGFHYPAPVEAIGLGRCTAVCTIYNGALDDARATAARIGLTIFNDAVLRAAIDLRVDALELRTICTDPADYANPIEPSGQGGLKIARGVAVLVGAVRASTKPADIWGNPDDASA